MGSTVQPRPERHPEPVHLIVAGGVAIASAWWAWPWGLLATPVAITAVVAAGMRVGEAMRLCGCFVITAVGALGLYSGLYGPRLEGLFWLGLTLAFTGTGIRYVMVEAGIVPGRFDASDAAEMDDPSFSIWEYMWRRCYGLNLLWLTPSWVGVFFMLRGGLLD